VRLRAGVRVDLGGGGWSRTSSPLTLLRGHGRIGRPEGTPARTGGRARCPPAAARRPMTCLPRRRLVLDSAARPAILRMSPKSSAAGFPTCARPAATAGAE
jgi:hypothetical protein